MVGPVVQNTERPQSRLHGIRLAKVPPPAPRACFGRGELIERVVGLAENLEPIALIGAGGIGKTSIALNVLHHDRIKKRFGDNRRFIRCDQFPASCLNFLTHLSKVIGAGVESLADLTPLRPLLSSKEMFIILDNAESILDPQGTNYEEIYAVMDELCQFETISLCITSRITAVPGRCKRLEIPTLSREAARNVFHSIYSDSGQSGIVDNLLQCLDFHALSITLLATTASNNVWDHDQLAWEWNVHRAQVLQTDHNEGLAATIELSLASSTFCKLGPDARDLLGVVAFFPLGIDEKNLGWLFPTISDRENIFGKFCALSLTYRSNGFTTMLAPIRDYLFPQDPRSSPLLCATKDHYFTRLSFGLGPDRPEFEALWIESEDANVERLFDVFASIDPRDPADGATSSAISIRSRISTPQTVPTSLNTDLNTNPPELSSTESVSGLQSQGLANEAHGRGPQDLSVGDPQVTGLGPQPLVDRHQALDPEWKRLISHPLPVDERISLIMAIFSGDNEADTVNRLHGDDAQTFADVIDEVLSVFSPRKSDSKLNFPFCQTDIECAAAMAPEEVSGRFAQNMRSFRLAPKIH